MEEGTREKKAERGSTVLPLIVHYYRHHHHHRKIRHVVVVVVATGTTMPPMYGRSSKSYCRIEAVGTVVLVT